MSNLRRYFKPNDTVFLTHVTYERIPILIEYYDLLMQSIRAYQQSDGFELIAWVILPDHFHMLLNAGNSDIPSLMKKIKLSFSLRYRKAINLYRGRLWQYRYWDHIIRDRDDFNMHIDYIHYNPVKHNVVDSPCNWKYSSFDNYLKQGIYDSGWGDKELKFDEEFGE